MIKTNLSSSEIQDLINKYNSELKKLEFQITEVRMTLLGLENLMRDVNSREKASFVKVKIKKSVKPKKSVAKTTKQPAAKKAKATKTLTAKVKAKKLTAPKSKQVKEKTKKVAEKPKKIQAKSKKVQAKTKKVVDKKGYKLSDWDNHVIQSIEQSGKVLLTSEIIDQVKSKLAGTGKKSTENEIKNKVTRSLQKLVNRRGDLAKVSYSGKGFAYAIPKWVVSKGKVSEEYSR